ncbi:MAG: hypothetical protein V3T96_04790 [Thermodesulfobacteriota bacterium]
MQKFFEGKRFHYIAVFLIAAATLIVYSNTFNASFHFDDKPHIIENYNLRSLKNVPAILVGHRGVTMATFALNYAVGGLNVVGYHIVDTVIHMVNGILVYLLIFFTLNIFQGSRGEVDGVWSKRIAIYSSLLFVVHPIQTQTVTYIIQRMESLASLFYLLALLFFIKGSRASTRTKRFFLYGGVTASYILGFYSKEIAITIPAVILLYDLYFISEGGIKGILSRWPLYSILTLLLLFFIAKTLVPLGGFGDVSEASAGFSVKAISPIEYLFTQFNVLFYYILLLIVPLNQSVDYDFPISKGLFEIPSVSDGTILNIPIPPPIVSLVILLAIIGFAICLFIRRGTYSTQRARAVSFFILWFFIILFPTSSFIPIMDVIFEHRLYLASVGFFVIFAIIFDGLFSWLGKRRKRA